MLAHAEFLDYIWVAVGTVLALPGTLFVTFVTVARLRMLSMIGSFVGTALGFLVTLFVWGAALGSTHLEGAVLLSVSFFVASVTGLVGALLTNFIFGGSNQRPRSTQVEF